MSDDRFSEDSTVFNKPPEKIWDGITLEDALRAAIASGQVEQIKILFELLPDEKKEHYREVYRKAKESA